jgi:hypothetical protein
MEFEKEYVQPLPTEEDIPACIHIFGAVGDVKMEEILATMINQGLEPMAWRDPKKLRPNSMIYPRQRPNIIYDGEELYVNNHSIPDGRIKAIVFYDDGTPNLVVEQDAMTLRAFFGLMWPGEINNEHIQHMVDKFIQRNSKKQKKTKDAEEYNAEEYDSQ